MAEFKSIFEELEAVRQANGGLLRPVDVVAFASDPKTKLHNYFTWDDTEAAAKYRLIEAQRVIRLRIPYNETIQQNVRQYVSLREDRVKPGGGYRALTEVMIDDGKRAALLAEARQDFEAFKRKYAILEQLAPLFAAGDEVLPKAKRKRRKKTG